MKPSVQFTLAAVLSLISTLAQATSLSQGTIQQPVNLGARSTPNAIPLGPVAWESNYSYGVASLISASRPSQHGSMEWRHGSVLEQNLAHAFGISVDLNSGLNLTEEAVTIHIKDWPKPAYSPYSKEQVLSATLHCMLLNAHATRERPMKLEIKADNPEDLAWATRYAGSYITRAEPDETNFTPTPVPGPSSLKTDRFGVTHVTFPPAPDQPQSDPPAARKPAPEPILIPFLPQAENESPGYELLPVWTGTDFKEPLDAIGRPLYLFYDLFNPEQNTPSVNSLFCDPPQQFYWGVWHNDKGTHVSISHGEIPTETLAATIYALVFSTQPTAEKPLFVTLRPLVKDTDTALAPFLKTPGWKQTSLGNHPAIECRFVLDAKQRQLKAGSIPALQVKQQSSGPIRLIWTK